MTEVTQTPGGSSGADRGVAAGGSVAQGGTVTSVDNKTSAIDWKSVDWSAVPWDQVEVPGIEKIPAVRKMQGTLNKQAEQHKREAARERAQREALQQQLAELRQVAAGTAPELMDQFQQVELRTKAQMLERQIGDIQQVEERTKALSAMAEHFEVDPELLLGAENVYDAVDILGGYWKLQNTNLSTQLAEMQRQLTALTARTNDPVSNPDNGATASANDFQTRYNEHMRSYHGDKAAAVRREAEAKGVTLDLSAWRK